MSRLDRVQARWSSLPLPVAHATIAGFRKKLFGSQLRLNMVAAMVGTGVTAVVIAFSYRVYLQHLGYEIYGLWLLLASVLTLVQLGSLGLAPALARLIAEDRERGEDRRIPLHITTAAVTVAASGLLLFGLTMLLRSYFIEHLGLTEGHAATAYRLLPYIVAASVYALVVETVNASLAGLGRVDLQHLTQTATSVLSTVVSMILLASGVGLIALLIGQVAGYVFLQSVTAIILRRMFRISSLWPLRWSRRSLSPLLSIGWSLCGSSILQLLLMPLNRFLLSRYAGLAAVPVYDLCFNSAMRLRNIVESGLRAIMPEVSALSVRRELDDVRRVQRLHQRALLLLLVIGGPGCVILLAASPWLLKLWLGSAYVPVLALAFRVAVVGAFLSLLGVPAFYVLLGLGRGRPLFTEKALHVGTSAALALGFVLSSVQVTPVRLLAVGAGGMGLSTGYLLYQYRAAVAALAAKASARAINQDWSANR